MIGFLILLSLVGVDTTQVAKDVPVVNQTQVQAISDTFEVIMRRIVLIKTALDNVRNLVKQDSAYIEGTNTKVKLDKDARAKIEKDIEMIKKELIATVGILEIFIKNH